MDWKDIAGKVGAAAPVLGTLLGGPAGGAVGSLIAAALGTKSDPEEVDAALAADPAAAQKLRELQAARAARWDELVAEQARLEISTAAADRASARDREVKSGDSRTPQMLAYGVTLGFFGVLAYLLHAGKPEQGGDALLVMLGSLGTAWAAVMNYYFGSSASSASKTQLLARK